MIDNQLTASFVDDWPFLLHEALEDYPHHSKEILELDEYRKKHVNLTNRGMFRALLLELLSHKDIKSKWERMFVTFKELAGELAKVETLHPLEKKYGVEPPIKDFDPYRWL